MQKNEISPTSGDNLKRGFPMVEGRDAASLEAERKFLAEIEARPHFWQRWPGYWKLTGPGWVQSALTLGRVLIFSSHQVYPHKMEENQKDPPDFTGFL